MCQCWSRGRVSRRTPSVPLAPKRSCARPSSHLPPLGAQLGRGALKSAAFAMRHTRRRRRARAGLRQGARGAAERRGRAGGDRLRRRLQVKRRGGRRLALGRLHDSWVGRPAGSNTVLSLWGTAPRAGRAVYSCSRTPDRVRGRIRSMVGPWPPWPPWPTLKEKL